jgi:hypothetical protein
MVTQEGYSPIGGMIEKLPIVRYMDMADAEEASGMAGQGMAKAIHMTFMAAGER